MARFAQGSDIFDNEDALRDNYTPDELIERDDEIETYEAALQPTVNGARPRNIFVYGETGVGKTLATRYILDDLEADQEHFEGVSIRVEWLNCKDLTSYQIVTQLVNKFREPPNEISPSGYGRGTVNRMLWSELNDLDETHVLFVLDEVDSIGSDDDLLYQLPRCNDNQVTETKVGLIGISNDFTFRESLSARVQSSLCEHEIHFKPYDANQLRRILEQRAGEAFLPDVLADDVIPKVAALAAQDTGSARHALDILYKAGSLARERQQSDVTIENVNEAKDLVERGVIEDELRALPTQSHLVLLAILRLHREGKDPVRRKTIYNVYENAAEMIDTDVKASRTIQNRLSQLSLKGFLAVDERNEGVKGGKYYQYSLDVREEIVEDALRQDRRIEDLI
ncbi:Cdc6/Cdc18 family protein [Halostella litorea]|uniref:Cdc6/Cdc18 family protein n=1 Tax=Halostella litorea TaxID=2528831 RepID=UPI001091A303|nr:orc1/cdc6 family replication initiation protein [Halostella litorea]